jgi:hypothetical protein
MKLSQTLSPICLLMCCFYPSEAVFAQDACTILASNLTPDISTQTSASQRFDIYQKIISQDKYSDFSTAQSSSLDLGLSILDYVDLSLGTTADGTSWKADRTKFLSLTFSQASASANFTSTTSKWNPAIIAAFVQGCVPKGFYGQITSVEDDHGSFTITLHGIGKWELEGIIAVPKDPKFSCGDDDGAKKVPISKINDVQISCIKDANITLSVSIANSQQNVGPFKILSVADDLRAKLDESGKLSEMKTTLLSKQIDDLRKSVDQQAIAISALKGGVNDALGKLQSLNEDGNPQFGFDTGTGDKRRKGCRPGYVVTSVAAYVEGSVKLAFFCSAIPKPQVQ